MGSRETQDKIIGAAIELFNAVGASSVSTNKIAELAGISKGNLHYHYSSKREIILAIWGRMEVEILSWHKDSTEPTIQSMAKMILRQYRQIWKYRFFYRELNILLGHDPELKFRFQRIRRIRMNDIFFYFKAMAANGVIKNDISDDDLHELIRISWIVSDFWLSFVAVENDNIDLTTMRDGYRLILQLFRPVFSIQAVREIPESFGVFSPDE